MKTSSAIALFGNQAKLAKALGLSRQAINKWGDEVPTLRALQIEKITGGAMPACQPHHAPIRSEEKGPVSAEAH